MKISTGLRDALLDGAFNNSAVACLDTTGRIECYTGSAPADADAAATGTLLGTLAFSSDAFGAASAGVITAAAITSDTSADATGTIGYAYIHVSGDSLAGTSSTAKRLLCTVGTSGADINFNSLSVVTAGTIACTSLTITMPAT